MREAAIGPLLISRGLQTHLINTAQLCMAPDTAAASVYRFNNLLGDSMIP